MLVQPGPDSMPLDLDNPSLTELPNMASMVHDLTNVLTIVLGSLEQLRRQPLDERGQQQLERADRGAERAGQIAHQILALASAAGSQPSSAR